MRHSYTNTNLAPALISSWLLCLWAWLWLLRAGFAWCTFSGSTEITAETTAPHSPACFHLCLSLIKPGTWWRQRMILGQLADVTRNFFSLWISFLLAQQAAGLAGVPWEASPLLIFLLFYSGETKQKLVNRGRQSRAELWFLLERESPVLQCQSRKYLDYMCSLENLIQTSLSEWITIE